MTLSKMISVNRMTVSFLTIQRGAADLEKIETPVEVPERQIPLTRGEMGDPEKVAQLAVFLSSEAARHITGMPIRIDGAQSLLQGGTLKAKEMS